MRWASEVSSYQVFFCVAFALKACRYLSLQCRSKDLVLHTHLSGPNYPDPVPHIKCVEKYGVHQLQKSLLVNCDLVETRFFVGLLRFPRFLGPQEATSLAPEPCHKSTQAGHWANTVWTFTDPRGHQTMHKNASLSLSHLSCEELFGMVLVCFCNTWDDECQKVLKCCPADFIFEKSTWLERLAKKRVDDSGKYPPDN